MSLLRSSLLACCVTAALAAQPALPPAPGKLFDIGDGRRLHLLCGGEGSPSIIFEAGLPGFAIDFTLVQRELQKTHRVCSYDRAGFGWSDPLRADALPEEARDLHALLAAGKEPAPFVLVGATRGGLLIRDYLLKYPADVAGLVFIDPATEDRIFGVVDGKGIAIAAMTPEEMQSTIPAKTVRIPRRPPRTGAPLDGLPPELYKQRVRLEEKWIAALPATLTPEQLGRIQEHERVFLASLLASWKAGMPFGSRPTIVLSSGGDRNQRRENSHKALASLSTNSRYMLIDGAGNDIHLSQPRAVITAVNDVLEAIAKKSQLRPE